MGQAEPIPPLRTRAGIPIVHKFRIESASCSFRRNPDLEGSIPELFASRQATCAYLVRLIL